MNGIRTTKEVLILEPFYGGSHQQLIDIICTLLQNHHISYDLLTLPSKKWHWKARTSAIEFYGKIDVSQSYNTIFCSSVLNLCELKGLSSVFSKSRTVVYFHENQLEYPVQKKQERDFQYGYNQILTALSADFLIFNSCYNMQSFLSKINKYIKKIPGSSFLNFEDEIRPKCHVAYFPVVSTRLLNFKKSRSNSVLQIVWAHRWEHDKDPKAFFDVLIELKNNDCRFQVAVLGEQFNEIPQVFNEAKEILGGSFIKHWGYVEEKQEFYSILASSDITISTALHEFFGVSLVEAVSLGCFPLCPNRLVYPEIFPKNCLYNTQRQLFKRLKEYCRNSELAKTHYDATDFQLERFDWKVLQKTYLNYLCPV